MPNFQHILTVVDAYIRAYKYHHLYDDLRSEIILYMATSDTTQSCQAVLAKARQWLRSQMRHEGADLDTIDDSDHPKTHSNDKDWVDAQDHLSLHGTERQQAIVRLVHQKESVDSIARILECDPKTIWDELNKIKKIKF